MIEVGHRVRHIDGREGIVQELYTNEHWLPCARVALDMGGEFDGPVGYLEPMPASVEKLTC